MARSRQLKPGFFTNDALCELPPLTRLLFAGLWCIADKAGRLEDRPKRIAAQILPYDRDANVDSMLNQLCGNVDPFIIRYELDGQKFIQICNWDRHQKPHWQETDSEIPAPDGMENSEKPLERQACVNDESTLNQSCVNIESTKAQERVEVTSNKLEVTSNKKGDPAELDRIENPALRASVEDWLAYKRERKQSYGETALKKFVSRVLTLAARDGPTSVIEKFDKAISQRYDGWDFGDGTRSAKTARDNSGRGAGSRERGL